MKRERQEFYFQLKAICWQITGTAQENSLLTGKEADIYFQGVIKLRGLEDKLKKEYKKEIKREEKTITDATKSDETG